MKNPIAYTYEADTHCADCTIAQFGDACEGIDREGNEVGAVFGFHQWWQAWEDIDEDTQILACGTCGREIDRVETSIPRHRGRRFGTVRRTS